MLTLANKFSALELCERGESEAAAQVADLSVGEWPKNVPEGQYAQAEAILEAGVIASVASGIQNAGDQTVAREMLVKSFKLFRGAPRRYTVLGWWAWSEYWSGRYARALAKVEITLEARIDLSTRFRGLLLRAVIYAHRGLLSQALLELERITPFYESLDCLQKGKFHNQRGRILRLMGETDRAIVEYDCADDFFQDAASVRWQAVVANNLAGLYLDSQRFPEAHGHAVKARSLFEQLGDKTYQAKAWDQTAQIFLAEGKLSEAERAINHAFALVEYGEILNELRETAQKIKNAQVLQLCHGRDNLPASPETPQAATFSPKESRNAMTPLDSALLLIQNEPENAVALLDLLIWASSDPDSNRHEAELAKIERILFSRVPECEEHREAYRQKRLMHLVPTAVDS